MSKASMSEKAMPPSVRKALIELGTRIKFARLRRQLTLADMAERMMVTVQTVQRLERGDPGVGIGVVASSLFVLGFMRELEGLADPMADRQAVNREFDNLLPVRRQPEEGDGTEAGPVVSDFNF